MKKKLFKIQLTSSERKKYLLPSEKDYEVLYKCKKLEKKKLTKEDRVLVELIKSQLEVDWHTPLLKILNKLLNKYDKK